MKLGAQFHSIKTQCKTPEMLKVAFKKIKDIGYEVAQMSGICEIDAELLKSYSEEYELPIACTHKPFNSIVNNTDELIKFHKIIGSPIIGLGSMPPNYRESLDGIREFLKVISEPVKKIKAAGLKFTYHNHAFEFETRDGAVVFDFLFEEAPDFDFIFDVYWSDFAGVDTMQYLEKVLKAGRMTDVHLKDMLSKPQGPICPCGEGVIDFVPIIELCDKYGVKNAHVEQDNAYQLGDVFEQMKTSYTNMYPLIVASRSK